MEWKNGVTLFLNLEGCSYPNVFVLEMSEEEQERARAGAAHPSFSSARVLWFAQARQTYESPVISKLLRPGAKVCLVCKVPADWSAESDGEDGYVYFGQLTVCAHSHDAGSPVRVVWQLNGAGRSQLLCRLLIPRFPWNAPRVTQSEEVTDTK